MPVGDEFDELLSGYIDGRLTREERRRVESVLSEPAVQTRLEQLRAVGDSLRLMASQTGSKLPQDFAIRVVAACSSLEREPAVMAEQGSISRPDYFQAASPLPNARLPIPLESTDGGQSRWPSRRLLARTAYVAVGLAALLMMAVWLPQWFSESIQAPAPMAERASESTGLGEATIMGDSELLANSSESGDILVDAKGQEGERISPVDPGRMATERGPIGQIQYALVLDVELAQDARDQQVIMTLFEKYGIYSLQGLRPNANIEQAINRMRFTVEERPKVRPAEIYLIRAPAPVLDVMLNEIQAEVDTFPAYRFDLAFQTPTLSLSQAIADAMGESDSLGESFALTLVNRSAEDKTGNESLTGEGLADDRHLMPFEAIPYQGNLVSTRRRQERIESSMDLGSGNDLGFLLLLVR